MSVLINQDYRNIIRGKSERLFTLYVILLTTDGRNLKHVERMSSEITYYNVT